MVQTRNLPRYLSKLDAIRREQADILRQINELKRRFRELERQRKTVIRSIERVSRKLERMSGSAISGELKRKIENIVNREGWMEKIIENRFKSQAEHGPGSRKWAKLSPVTIKRKGFNRILFETGEMYAGALQAVSGTYRIGRPIRWNIGKVGVEYARYHQEGTERMPARPFLDPPTPKELGPTERRVTQLIRQEMRKAGA